MGFAAMNILYCLFVVLFSINRQPLPVYTHQGITNTSTTKLAYIFTPATPARGAALAPPERGDYVEVSCMVHPAASA